MGTTRRDFLKGLMATTAVAALPVAAAETVFMGADWGAGPSITALHMARGQAFFWIVPSALIHELRDEIMKITGVDTLYDGAVGEYRGIRFVESADQNL